jgi:Fe-S-cluster containining protein
MPHPSDPTRIGARAEVDVASWQRWFDAAGDEQIAHRLMSIIHRVDEAVAQRGPTCWASGKCCNFDAYGHRMYVTCLEIAWFLRQVAGRSDGHSPLRGEIDVSGPCPLQRDGLCGVHDVRPLGCRVFFCERGTQQWQHALYERSLSEIRRLHDEHHLPYAYVEWRRGLAEGIVAMVKLTDE